MKKSKSSSSSSGSSSDSSSSSSSSSRSRSKSKGERTEKKQREVFDTLHIQGKMKAERIKEAFGYTNEDNPFGDTHLSKQFIWKKKLDKMEKLGKEINISKDELIVKQEEFIKDIEKVKQRRAEREIEKLKLDDQKNVLSREKEEEIYEQWLEKEENFHKEQSKIRPLLRIEQGRLKPIDNYVRVLLLYQNKLSYTESFEHYMKRPIKYLKQLTVEELTDLITEANYLKTQKSFENVEEGFEGFWHSLIRIAEEVLSFKEKDILKTRGYSLGKNDNFYIKEKQVINEEYENEIKNMIKHKNIKELQKLEDEINESLKNKEFTMDIEYWDLIIKKLDYFKARLKLDDFYNDFMSKNEEKFKLNPSKYPANIKVIEENIAVGINSPYLIECDKDLENLAITEDENLYDIQEERKKVLEDEISKALTVLRKNLKKTKYEQNKNAQNLLNKGNKHEIEDQKNYTDSINRMNVDEEINDRAVAEQIMNFERSKPLKPNEEKFDDLVEIKKIYDWTEKYKPRKPIFYNRVKTGYEWNKYNQTHYDYDNLPPRVIQGYKFNIFYPDLIDKKKTPEYVLEASDNPQFCIIKFKAGPPYEDIAFKILNREWDFADKKGFKSIFSRGILHLYFNFKKYRYRR